MDLYGETRVVPPHELSPKEGASIHGMVRFNLTGPLDGPLLFLPDFALRTATQAVTKLITAYARDDFVGRLVNNYEEWSSITSLHEKENREI